jgi:hypothetical protein
MRMGSGWRLRGMVLGWCTAVAVSAVVVVPAAPANAVVDGTGWSWQWRYTSPNDFTFTGTLAGVHITGFGTDDDGIRQVWGTMTDTTPRNGACAVLKIFGPDGRQIFSRNKLCLGSDEFVTRPFRSVNSNQVVFELNDFKPDGDGGIGWVFRDRIQSSITVDGKDDTEFRNPSTAAFWQYVASDRVQFGISRPGVRLMGEATHEGINEQSRTASATLEHFNHPGLGVTGQMWGDYRGDTGRVVTRGDPKRLVFGRSGLNGNLYHEACRWLNNGQIILGVCIKGKVPLPVQ